ncbi:MAG: M20/M25/M40 family metallo-hydrolase [Anaerolineales bacterium]|nr:M20/M25/M40 family metallo-hydrolase [Anaerolineales bacterium]
MTQLVEKSDLDNACDFIKRVCVEIGPGSPCSPQERARAGMVKAEMEKFADEVREEPFVCAPGAFLQWFQFASVLGVLSAVFFHLGLLPFAPLLFTTLGLGMAGFIFLILIFEFILGREFIDGIYPKKPSLNIAGILRPKTGSKPPLARGERGPKRILMFGGHHDSALQFNYLHHFKNGYFVAEGILIIGVLVFSAGLLLHWLSMVFARPWGSLIAGLQWYTWIVLPVSVFIGFTFTERDKNGGSVPGAIDNLSAVSILLMIGRALKRHPEWQPADTEIRLLSFGSEEAGARGSLAYVRAHETELKAADAVFINFESIYDPEIEIFTGDRNGTIRNAPDVVDALVRAAVDEKLPFRVSPFPFAGGGTDAMPFREKGIRAGCLFGMRVPSQMVDFYHQPSDSYDIVNPQALGHALRIALEFIRRF